MCIYVNVLYVHVFLIAKASIITEVYEFEHTTLVQRNKRGQIKGH